MVFKLYFQWMWIALLLFNIAQRMAVATRSYGRTPFYTWGCMVDLWKVLFIFGSEKKKVLEIQVYTSFCPWVSIRFPSEKHILSSWALWDLLVLLKLLPFSGEKAGYKLREESFSSQHAFQPIPPKFPIFLSYQKVENFMIIGFF